MGHSIKPKIYLPFILSSIALSSAHAQDAQGEASIDILHLWAAESEQKALGVFRDAALDTGVSWEETPIGSSGYVQVELSNLITIGQPPSVVHWVIDPQLKTLIDRGVFVEIPDPEGKFKDLYVPEVYEMIATENGGITSAAVGIHSYNFLVYNKDILEKYDLEPANSLDDLLEYGDILAQDGIYLSSISTQSWQMLYPLISAFSTEFTKDEMFRLLTDGENVSDLRPQLLESFTFLTNLIALSDPNTEEQEWTDSVKKVDEGQSLVLFMGDFAVPQFQDESKIICQTAPGASDFYFGLDSFAFPKTDDPQFIEGQKRFVEITTDPEFVTQYVNLKGGLPTIQGVRPEDLLPCHAENLERWNASGKIWMRSEPIAKRASALTEFLGVQVKKEALDPEQMTDELINLFNNFY